MVNPKSSAVVTYKAVFSEDKTHMDKYRCGMDSHEHIALNKFKRALVDYLSPLFGLKGDATLNRVWF